ncbi:methyltransferase domain-containing protein [Streptomyces rimosus]|uniref:methyltransferase domain-containing protein n=1 Tax=Streptomyces rimosus TaxID=1927 RepID=UPI00379DAF16
MRAEVHALPIEAESFDAIVSVDALEYSGTADSYLPYLVRFLRPGGQLGVATPAMTREVREPGAIPPGRRDWLLWTRACAARLPGDPAHRPVIGMLTANGGDGGD